MWTRILNFIKNIFKVQDPQAKQDEIARKTVARAFKEYKDVFIRLAHS